MKEGYERGRAVAEKFPLYCVPFEELLPLPLDEARRRMGVPPLADPKQDPASWLSTGLASGFSGGFGKMDAAYARAALARVIVESGVSVRDLMSAPESKQKQLRDLAQSGASAEAIRTAAVA